jgi:hypothetical protein
VTVRAGAAAAIVVLLAGCAGGGQGGGGTGPSPADLDVDSNVLGAVSGVVVDEAIRPLANVKVTLVSQAREATSDADGLFAFTDLEPGFYAMTAMLPLYLPTQVTADVVAGQTAKVKVQLAIDPTPQPYHVTYKHDGYMQAWATIAEYEVQEGLEQAAPLCDCRLNFTPEGKPSTLVYEAFWEETSPNPGEFEFYWVVEQPESGARSEEYCSSPCQAHIDGDAFEPGVPAYARLDGPDEWLVYDQRFQIFLTIFYNGKAPDGWTVLDSA